MATKSLTEFLSKRDLSELTAEVSISADIPYRFKIKALTREKRADFQRRCQSPIKRTGQEFDSSKFQSLVCIECCLEPNFADADFVSSVGATTAVEAYGKVLLPGEDDALYSEIIKLSGYSDEDINSKVEEAKN